MYVYDETVVPSRYHCCHRKATIRSRFSTDVAANNMEARSVAMEMRQ